MAERSKTIPSESDKRQRATRAALHVHAVNRARRLAGEAARGNHMAARALEQVPSNIRKAAALQCAPGIKRGLLLRA